MTGYAHNDTNNFWIIVPTKALPETGRGRIVRNEDIIQLLHASTQSYLLTHDVASPTMPTNQEFTTWPRDDHSRHNDTLFHLKIVNGMDNEAWKTKSGQFRLIHVPTKVSLWTHNQQLDDWAFKQQEINGNKDPTDRSAVWFVDEIVIEGTHNPARQCQNFYWQNEADEIERDEEKLPAKSPKKLNFFWKFAELQLLMLQHNAGLTASHPYASTPINWPFLISGISFWTDNDLKRQIYLIGNVIGWWTCAVAMSIYIGILGADLLARRRGMDPVPDRELICKTWINFC